MKRIVTRFLYLVVFGVFAGCAVSACASDSSAPMTAKLDAGAKDAGKQKLCSPTYCQYTPPAAPCCLNAVTCGVDYGSGCTAVKKDGGAQ